jgi:hypothetical protein
MDQDEKIDEVVDTAADDADTQEISVDGDIPNGASNLLNLEELIKNHIESIDKLRDELKQQREMFEDSFNNNPTYKEHTEKVKEANKAKSSVRSQIAKQPSVAVIDQKIKDIRFDVNEQSKTLSDLLQDYKEQTGATQIELRNGQIMEIVSTTKLVRKNTKYNP